MYKTHIKIINRIKKELRSNYIVKIIKTDYKQNHHIIDSYGIKTKHAQEKLDIHYIPQLNN